MERIIIKEGGSKLDPKKGVAKYILKLLKENKLEKEIAVNILEKLKNEKKDIAIIGMSCRFAKINNQEEFWNSLVNEEIMIDEFPLSRRKDTDRYLDVPEDKIPNEYFKGGFIEEVDKFEPEIFKIPEEEAKYMSPEQKIFLEIARDTFEDAGYLRKDLKGSSIGVYVGADNTSKQMGSYLGLMPDRGYPALIGNWISCLAGRVSHVFDLRGPTFVIDSACCSAATAIHLACKTLHNKECDMVLAGGINIFTLPLDRLQGGMFENLGARNFLTRVFDKEPGGLYMSEGAGAVLLKPLSKAIEDRDNIYAVIKGSALNNNGTDGNLEEVVPQVVSDVVIKGINEAKINPETIEYFEAHGDADVLSDALELESLTSAFSRYTNRKQFCAIGSLNANIGYVAPAFGIAALIKTSLALNKKIMPSMIGFQQPNPNTNFAKSAFYICDKTKKWEKREEHPRRAGLFTLGLGGTNASVILEEAPLKENIIDEEKDKQIFTISARTKKSLKNQMVSLLEYFKTEDDLNYKDICYTMNVGRGDYQERVAILVDDLDDLIEKMEKLTTKSLITDEKNNFFYKASNPKLPMQEKRKLESNGDKIIKEILESAWKEEKLTKLCKLYVDGGNIDWDKLYKDKNRYKCSLPTYSFDKKRSWFM